MYIQGRRKMSGSTRDPEETRPLRKKEAYREGTLENNAVEKDGGAMSFVLSQPQPPPLGFIYLPVSQQSTDNPYETQPPFNPSYKPVEDTIVPWMNDAAERGNDSAEESNVKGNETSAEDTDDDTCITCCIMIIVIAVVVAVICGIVYFAVKHPKLAKALQNIVTEVKKHDHDDDDVSLMKKIINPTITNELVKFLNETTR